MSRWPVTVDALLPGEKQALDPPRTYGTFSLTLNTPPLPPPSEDAEAEVKRIAAMHEGRKLYERQIKRLAKLMVEQATEHGVVVFHLREVSSLYMPIEGQLFHLLRALNTKAKHVWKKLCHSDEKKIDRHAGQTYWSHTCPLFRHGGGSEVLGLVTIYNQMLHLCEVSNFHFSHDVDHSVPGDLQAGQVWATSNAAVMMFVPLMANGFTVDTRTKWVHINAHLPLRPEIKTKAMYQLLEQAALKGSRAAAVTIFMDANTFSFTADRKEVDGMIQGMRRYGDTSADEDGCLPVWGGGRDEKSCSTFLGLPNLSIPDPAERFGPTQHVERYRQWVEGGDAEVMTKLFGAHNAVPLDWVVHMGRFVIEKKQGYVMNATSFRQSPALSKAFATLEQKENPDYASFLSDHWPLLTFFELQPRRQLSSEDRERVFSHLEHMQPGRGFVRVSQLCSEDASSVSGRVLLDVSDGIGFDALNRIVPIRVASASSDDDKPVVLEKRADSKAMAADMLERVRVKMGVGKRKLLPILTTITIDPSMHAQWDDMVVWRTPECPTESKCLQTTLRWYGPSVEEGLELKVPTPLTLCTCCSASIVRGTYHFYLKREKKKDDQLYHLVSKVGDLPWAHDPQHVSMVPCAKNVLRSKVVWPLHLAELERQVQRLLIDRGDSHGWPHIQRVVKWAYRCMEDYPDLGTDEQSDTLVLALLHDLNDPKYADEQLGEVQRDLLHEYLRTLSVEQGLKIIKCASWSDEKKRRPDLRAELGPRGEMICRVVANADRLDALGQEGFDRCWDYSCEKMQKERKCTAKEIPDEDILLNVVRHACEKLLILQHHIHGQRARQWATTATQELERSLIRNEKAYKMTVLTRLAKHHFKSPCCLNIEGGRPALQLRSAKEYQHNMQIWANLIVVLDTLGGSLFSEVVKRQEDGKLATLEEAVPLDLNRALAAQLMIMTYFLDVFPESPVAVHVHQFPDNAKWFIQFFQRALTAEMVERITFLTDTPTFVQTKVDYSRFHVVLSFSQAAGLDCQPGTLLHGNVFVPFSVADSRLSKGYQVKNALSDHLPDMLKGQWNQWAVDRVRELKPVATQQWWATKLLQEADFEEAGVVLQADEIWNPASPMDVVWLS